jgi:hypothetical protein
MSPLTQDILKLTNDLPLPVVVIGAGTAIDIFNAIKGIKANALPELMTTGPVELGFRFSSEIVETSLKIFNLGDRHDDDPATKPF